MKGFSPSGKEETCVIYNPKSLPMKGQSDYTKVQLTNGHRLRLGDCLGLGDRP